MRWPRGTNSSHSEQKISLSRVLGWRPQRLSSRSLVCLAGDLGSISGCLYNSSHEGTRCLDFGFCLRGWKVWADYSSKLLPRHVHKISG